MSVTTNHSRPVGGGRPVTTGIAVPAYVRGIPARVWQSALRHPDRHVRTEVI